MKPTQTNKILNMLRNSPSGITSRDMIDANIFKYSSRIAELRKQGYYIHAERVKGSLWLYKLITSQPKVMSAEDANEFLHSIDRPIQAELLK